MTTDEIFAKARAFQDSGQYEQALLCYEFILKYSPTNAQVWAHLGVALRHLGRTTEAITAYGRALELSPADAEIHNNLGVALQFSKAYTQAIASYHKAWQLRPDYHQARMREGMVQLLLGNFEEGLPLYEARLETIPPHRSKQLSGVHWHGQLSPRGKRILLYAEQGLGDTLQFARYAPLLAAQGAQVFLEAQPALVPLLAPALQPEIQVFATGQDLPPFDLHCPLLSLPRAFHTRLETIPSTPLRLAIRTDVPSRKASEKLRVGFVWAGNPSHSNDQNRSIPLELLLPLLRLPHLVPIVLQKDLKADDPPLLASLPHHENPATSFHDFRDTATVLAGLDCIITVDTAVAHLAACHGVPTLLLLSTSPDWRWLLDREDSPWYPNLRIFRQPEPGDWASVIKQIALHLQTQF